MGYYEDQYERRKKQIEDLLTNRPAQIESDIQGRRDMLAEQDARNEQGLTDVLGRVSAQYGLSPTTVQAGLSQRASQQPALSRQRETTLSTQRMQNMNDFFNQKYSYAVDAYTNAGYNLSQSDEFARKWARQQTDQAFQSEMNQKSRDYTQERTTIANRYQDVKDQIKMENGDPYQEALIRTLTGLAPYAGYAAYQKYGQQPQQPKQTFAGVGIQQVKNPNKGTAGIGGYGGY